MRAVQFVFRQREIKYQQRQPEMNMPTKHLTILLFPALLAACASEPIIDPKGVNTAQYRQDLAECQAIADQVKVGQKAAGSAVAGAVVGAAVGAAVGNSNTAQRAAGAGATVGAAKGAGRGVNERQRVVRNCLRGRGYQVLN